MAMTDLGSMQVIITGTDRLSGKLKTAGTNVKGFGNKVDSMGLSSKLGFAALASSAIYGLKTAIKWSVEFEKELANVSTMLDETTMSYMGEFEEGLKNMATAYGESTSTLAKGLYQILSASIDASQALDVLEVSSKAATAGLTDTGTAADAITTIMNSYSDSNFSANDVSDMLFATVKKGKTTFEELANSIGKSATLASQAGVKFNELSALLSTLTRAGISTEEATTAVNGILRGFLKPTEEAKEAAKKFGIELNTATIKSLGLVNTMRLLTGASQEQLAAMFPNIRGLKGVAGALGDLEGFANDANFVLASFGLTEEALEKQTGTLGFQMGKLWETFKIGVEEEVGPLAEGLKYLATSFNKLTDVSGKTGEAMGKESEIISDLKSASQEYVDAQNEAAPKLEDWRVKQEKLYNSYEETKNKIDDLKDSLKDYLDVQSLEGYEDTTDELRKLKIAQNDNDIAMKELEISGQKGSDTYVGLQEKSASLGLQLDLERDKLEKIRLQNESLQDTASDMIDKNKEHEKSYDTLTTALVDNIKQQDNLEISLTSQEKAMKDWKKFLDEQIMKSAHEAENKINDLRISLENLRAEMAQESAKLRTVKEEGKSRVQKYVESGAFLGGIPGAGAGFQTAMRTITQNNNIYTQELGEAPDDVFNSLKRAGG